jgi:hypothetical protein
MADNPLVCAIGSGAIMSGFTFKVRVKQVTGALDAQAAR